MKRLLVLTAVVALLPLACSPPQPAAPASSQPAGPALLPPAVGSGYRVRSLRIFILSTAVAGAQSMKGFGEWGFAALVEVDGHHILYDTGLYSDTVLRNAHELGVDLSKVRDVVLSHNHNDHAGGLVKLRRYYAKINPEAMSRCHVGQGIFWRRPSAYGELNPMPKIRVAYEEDGGTFLEHDRPVELLPGVWFSGPVPRPHDERNYSLLTKVIMPDGTAPDDTLPEDSSLIFNTDKGMVLITGCGHAGLINSFEYAQKTMCGGAPAYAAVGGFHLYQKSDKDLEWTALMLRQLGLKHYLGAHCTGIESVMAIRQLVGLDRKTCVVGSIGASFSLDRGIDPEALAK
jgi:7,8-dihydropterin-6-yl-methyl-4-(beta-D-ribofuranosyl)aminobenzene 5'-phosphate synthase